MKGSATVDNSLSVLEQYSQREEHFATPTSGGKVIAVPTFVMRNVVSAVTPYQMSGTPGLFVVSMGIRRNIRILWSKIKQGPT